MINWLYNLSLTQACLSLLGVNVGMFVLSLFTGGWLVRSFGNQPVTPPPDNISRQEIRLAITCVLLNTLVAVIGWCVWKRGIIVLKNEFSWRIMLDVVVLLLAMDFFMYLLHRVAHHPVIFPIVHRTHHIYDRPHPISLFVLNPFEVLGFGSLWLIVISFYTCTWVGMILYLAANLAFGTIGHLGVEPYPRRWKNIPILKHLGSSTFHANHHQDENVNYGFYTDIWDRLFKTLKI